MIAFFVHIPFLGLLCWYWYRQNQTKPLIDFFWWGLVAKLLAGVIIGLLYSYYYSYQGDTLLYFHDASKLSTFARSDPATYIKILVFNGPIPDSLVSTLSLWYQPRAFFMAKLVSMLCLFTWNNYWLCGVYLSLLSFAALWTLANTLVTVFPSSYKAAAIAFLLFPSMVMFSAGVTKESIAMVCIAGILQICFSWKFIPQCFAGIFSRILAGVLLLCFLWLLWKLKYYYLAALVPAWMAFLITNALVYKVRLENSSNIVKVLVLIGVFAFILTATTFIHPNLRIENFLQALVTNHAITISASNKQNIIHFYNLQPTISSLLQNLPEAIFSGLFRPFLGEGSSIFHYYVGVENLLLFSCLVYVLLTIGRWLKMKNQSHLLLTGATLVYILLLASLLALSSPNFGALSRYKVAFLPFFVYLLYWAAFTKKANL